MTLRVRALPAEWWDKTRKWDTGTIGALYAALAVAIPALKEHEGECVRCDGNGGTGRFADRICEDCDGTGSNPARRALDTVIGEGS